MVVYHAARAVGLPILASRAYLAVDFFFVLSGFVLAQAYESKLTSGEISAISFLRLRVIRLWPLVLLGMLLGFLVFSWAPAAMSDRSWPASFKWLALVFGLLLLPNPTPGVGAYPLNPPTWSVVYELVVNYGYAVFRKRLTPVVLRVLILISGFILAVTTVRDGTANTLDPARVVYSFFLGVLLSRGMLATPRASGHKTILLVVSLAVVLFTPDLGILPHGVFDALCCIAIFPSIVWLGARVEPPQSLKSWCSVSGELSYPLYAIHYPIVVLSMTAAASRLSGELLTAALLPLMLGTFGLSIAVARTYDQPLRAAILKVRQVDAPVPT